MIVRRTDPDEPITWKCNSCDDNGLISGWADSPHDLRLLRPHSSRQVNQVLVSDLVAEVLRDIQLFDPDCDRVVYGAAVGGAGVVLFVTGDELDELIGYVVVEVGHQANRRRRQRLEVALEELVGAARDRRWPSAVPDEVHDEPAVPAEPRVTDLPELDVARVQRWCAARVPERARHQIRVECQLGAGDLTIVERRAPWDEDSAQEWTSSPIAQLRYARTARSWTLYWRDRNLRYRAYDPMPSSPHIAELLAEIGRDPNGIFWG